jgi:large subunit ribosomal protein L3
VNIGLLGKKIGMTHIFDNEGNVTPVTLIKVGPCTITQIKTNSTCGYNAIQLGYLELSSLSKKLTKPLLNHFSKKNIPPFKYLKEYKINNPEDFQIGECLNINMFNINDFIKITGKTIGKGNAGNIKKNHFNRGAMTHGSKHHRLQGSMGAGTSPGRVFPGKKMPGRLGGNFQTIKHIKIVDINVENNLIVVKGSIPGKIGNIIIIKKNS